MQLDLIEDVWLKNITACSWFMQACHVFFLDCWKECRKIRRKRESFKNSINAIPSIFLGLTPKLKILDDLISCS